MHHSHTSAVTHMQVQANTNRKQSHVTHILIFVSYKPIFPIRIPALRKAIVKYEALYLAIQVHSFLHVRACTSLNFCTWYTHTHTQHRLGADSLFMVSKSDTFGLEIELRQQATKCHKVMHFLSVPAPIW